MKKNYKLISVILSAIFLILCFAITTSAAESPKNNKYYYEKVVNAGKDTGFSDKKAIKKDDPHFGWKLGRFCIEGYTDKTEENGKPVFLKTVGDEVTLSFELEQDINKLNGNKTLSIFHDKNGYDNYFGIEKSDFGRGLLVVKKTDSQNHTEVFPPYKNYLSGIKKGASTKIQLCEEGDYEVALDYEIKKEKVDIFGWNPFSSYYNYRILFKFSVKNGNCMVYPFDVATKAELTNDTITENGFYIDFANSKDLDVYIKRETRSQGADEFTEDIRYNRPVKDNEEFKEEGIYTITAVNKYTKQATVKVIYVGKDNVLKAYVALDGQKAIADIEQLIAEGAKVSADGTVTLASGKILTATGTNIESENETIDINNPSNNNHIIFWVIFGIAVVLILVSINAFVNRKRRTIIINTDNNGDENK